MNHDRFFKELLRTFFVEFIKLFLPDVARYIDFNSIEFLDKEIFTDITSAESHEVDLIVKVRFRRGGRAFFVIHVENQASSRKSFAKRMFRYFARLHEKFDLPIFPVAIFSFDRPRRQEPDRYQVDFPEFRVLDFAFRAIQLNRLNWRDFLRNPNPVASALMTKMRIAPEDRPSVKLECLRMLATLKLDEARAKLIGAFMTNYLKLTNPETAVYDRMLESVEPKEREVVMQLTNEWIEKGREEGLQESRGLVLRQLRRRVGDIPAKLARQVDRLNDAEMIALGDALLDFTSPADAQRWLAQRNK